MTVRRKRKLNKLRGQRKHGHGDTKNRRGGGSRGGRGKAGSHKHKYTKYFATFGTEKKKVKGKQELESLNLDQIQQFLPKWVAEGKAVQSAGEITVDARKAGFSKIVARGQLHSKVVFENAKASKRAAEKLGKSGCVLKWHETEDNVEESGQ